jgi:ribosomal protein S18 acetylase RimI-like enzyme
MDKRISQTTIDWWRQFKDGSKSNPVLLIAKTKEGKFIAISGCNVHNGNTDHSFTIVDPDFRNRDIGTNLLKIKREMLASDFGEPKFQVGLNIENLHAIAMCKSAGLKELSRKETVKAIKKKRGAPVAKQVTIAIYGS